MAWPKELAQGKVEEARRILFRQGQRRFGPPDQATVDAIESIGLTERIEGLLDRLLEVSNWEELLAVPPEGGVIRVELLSRGRGNDEHVQV